MSVHVCVYVCEFLCVWVVVVISYYNCIDLFILAVVSIHLFMY